MKPKAAKKPISLSKIRATAAKKKTTRRTMAKKMAAPVRKVKSASRVKATANKKIAAEITKIAKKASAPRKLAPFNPVPLTNDGKPVERFSKADLAEFRKELIYMRDRLDGKIARAHEVSLKRADGSGRVEEGSEVFERAFMLECAGGYQRMVRHINEALRSIEEGTYGICQRCGGLIRKPRLQALPFARNCIRCQSLIEKGR